MYKKIDQNKQFTQMEKEIRDFWKDNEIMEKNLKMNDGKEYFTFYDGRLRLMENPMLVTF